MKIIFTSAIMSSLCILILFSLFENPIYSTESNQQYKSGYSNGCHDGQKGNSPDLTQYDRVDGFSKHTIDYNNGYVDGYNKCSNSQQIDPLIE